jgi:hypothetical protein
MRFSLQLVCGLRFANLHLPYRRITLTENPTLAIAWIWVREPKHEEIDD